MRRVLLLVLLFHALQIRINIITSIVIDELPFLQNLTCIDCFDPVLYEATGFPDFAAIEENQLIIDGQPRAGQYHLGFKMTDDKGRMAHVLLILILLD